MIIAENLKKLDQANKKLYAANEKIENLNAEKI